MTALTSREITAMTAHAAAIKAENHAYTRGRLSAGQVICGLEIKRNHLFNATGTLLAAVFTTPEARGEADARRLAACWNVCDGIPTETLESCSHWSDIVTAPLQHRAHIPAEAAAIGPVLDPHSLEQGDFHG